MYCTWVLNSSCSTSSGSAADQASEFWSDGQGLWRSQNNDAVLSVYRNYHYNYKRSCHPIIIMGIPIPGIRLFILKKVPVFLCMLACRTDCCPVYRWAGCWSTLSRRRGWACPAPPSTPCTCSTAPCCSWTLWTRPASASSSAPCSWGCARADLAPGSPCQAHRPGCTTHSTDLQCTGQSRGRMIP